MPQSVLLDDLQAFFTRYAAAYRTASPETILPFFAMPLTRATSARQTVLEDEEAALASLDQLIAQFEAKGVANARIATIEVGTVTDDAAEVNLHWELLNASDEPLVGYDAGYSLARTGEHQWRIAEIREHEQNRALAGPDGDALAAG